MYSFFLGNMQLPIPPSKLQLKIANENKTIKLLDLGEVNILKAPGLTEITFECLIPQAPYPFATYRNGFRDATYFLGEFERIKTSRQPVQFIVSRFTPDGRFLFDSNIKVSLEEYTITEEAKEGRDVVISVKLLQYRDFGTKRITITQSSTASTKPAATVSTKRPAPAPAKTYTVKSGDTLWGICKKQLGDGAKYPEIARLNNIKNPNLIFPGQVIKFG